MDWERLGRRISEERRLRKISQEKMAEDLCLYQSDISHLEHAQRGSGITDLSRLENIAGYFDIPLESLLFDFNENHKIIKYHKESMDFRPMDTKKLNKHHRRTLSMITGQEEGAICPYLYQCGPYSIYLMREVQSLLLNVCPETKKANTFDLYKPHVFVFFDTELIATMSIVQVAIMHFINSDLFDHLRDGVAMDVLDVTDTLRTLNPYIALLEFPTEQDDPSEMEQAFYKRMEALCPYAEQPVLLIESVYVRENFRRNGICRMMMDLLDLLFHDHITWLNMEPTSGDELNSEYDYFPSYTLSGVGQLNLNASIAEKLGFRVDPDCWHREAEVLNPEGKIETKVIEIRKCAYKLSPQITGLLEGDGDLVAVGRARQKIAQADQPDRTCISDFYTGTVDDHFVVQIKINEGGRVRYTFGYLLPDGKCFLAAADRSVFNMGLNGEFMEQYHGLEEARNSEYIQNYSLIDSHCRLFPPKRP